MVVLKNNLIRKGNIYFLSQICLFWTFFFKWNNAVIMWSFVTGFFHFVYVLKIHTYCSMCQYFIFLMVEQYLLYGYSSLSYIFSSVQSLSCVQLFVTPCTAARQASLSITNSQSLLKLVSIESVMPSNHLILCCPLLLPPSISQHQGLFQ